MCEAYLALHGQTLDRLGVRSTTQLQAVVCHSSADKGLAGHAMEALGRLGLRRVLSHDTDLPSPVEWSKRVEQDIEDSDVTVVFATREGATSESLSRDVSMIRALGKFMVLLSDDVSAVIQSAPFRDFADRHFISITPDADWPEQLMAAVAT